MIARAKRAFSGMVMSVMLVAPALATQSATAYAGTDSSTQRPSPQRHQGSKAARKAPAGQVARRLHASVAPSRRTALYASVARGFSRSGFNEAPIRETMSETGFVNDGGALMRDAEEGGGAAADARPQGARRVIQTGLASWYGPNWQGRSCADGSRFDMNDLTAAHRSLPLGSRVRVTRLDDGQSVVVRITDRPGTRTRIIDLSRAAASKLGMLDQGLARVALETP